MKNLYLMFNLVILLGVSQVFSMETEKILDLSPTEALNTFYREYVFEVVHESRDIMPKDIGTQICDQIAQEEKNQLLVMGINEYANSKRKSILSLIATILVYAGAQTNICFDGVPLLHKALQISADKIFCHGQLLSDDRLLKALYDRQENWKDCEDHFLIGPVFFAAPDIKSAKMFIEKGVKVTRVNKDDHTVLWHLIDVKFPPELIEFYLNQGVNVDHICKFDGSCVLHEFAKNYDITPENEDNFIAKIDLLVKKSRRLNVRNNAGETPAAVARRTIDYWGGKYLTCVKPLEKLIKLLQS